MTTTIEPRTADADDPATVETADVVKTATADVTADRAAGPDAPAPRRRLTQIMWAVAAVAALAGLVVAAVGFGLSYGALVDAARGWGFGPRGSYAFPLGIDGLIIALYSIDLVLVWRGMPKPLLLVAAHITTGVTVVLNVLAAADSAPGSRGVREVMQTDPGRLLAHAAMPVAYVLLTEAARHLITRTARLESGAGVLALSDWLLDPRGTWKVWRRSKLHGYTYADVRKLERERAVYRVWLQHREEIEAGLSEGAVSVLDRLPDLLAPHGVTVEEALQLPDRMRREEQERRAAREHAARQLQQQAAAEERAQAHADRLAQLAAEAEALKAQAEVDVLSAQVDGERQAAQHRAAAAADTAGIEAAAARSAAERAATEAQRRAAAEEEAEESARTAALRRRAAEDAKTALATEEQNVRRREQLAAAARRTADAEAEAKQRARRAAEDDAATAAAARRAAEDRAVVARAELAAVVAEDAAGLTERERNVRRVARLILTQAGGEALRLPLAKIEAAMGVTNSTASGYREAAGQLIASGYDHRTDPLHTVDQEIYR
ncbi:DUF2637 domain-containing protein [Streptomyces sp. MBT97]|uniref:DUF2637 domain-containing protein n=1 Tax=Streptomyces sp. MBT97 TaxID=2800411 RepID=UPI00190B5738|nr:DUF2637 domain-containing protein [Streptomyces sp. MBT97]MBK3636734.1 DUF2637 domain-containing protein [Streptomyces sp. MBT97]